MSFAFMGVFMALFFAVFTLVLTTIIVQLIRGAGQWKKNNHSPVLNVHAIVVSKRTQISGGGGSSDHHHASRTTYYVTFQVDSGDRMELNIPTNEYGFLVEQDSGELTFQGTRYLSFQRR